MRALFKDLLKGAGTPVIQTHDAGGETILSAANIWTSAHARRIVLRERGLGPGDVFCSEAPDGFRAAIDVVACAIGGFVYLPAAPRAFAALREDIASAPVAGPAGIMLVGRDGEGELHASVLPEMLKPLHASPDALLAFLPCRVRDGPSVHTGEAIEGALARLAQTIGTPVGGTRLSARAAHHHAGLVVDLLLALCNRQTIYLRGADWPTSEDCIAEAIALGLDDLVLAPALLAAFARESRSLDPEAREALSRIRFHTGGEPLSRCQREIAESLFDKVFVEGSIVPLAA